MPDKPKEEKLKTPPYTDRSAWLLYRIQQCRCMTRDQIKRMVFGEISPNPISEGSQEKQMTDYVSCMLLKYNDWLRYKMGMIYVSNNGIEILSGMLNNPEKLIRVPGWADAFNQIDNEFIDPVYNPGREKRKFQTGHHKLRAETLLHLLSQGNIKTDSTIRLEVEGLSKIIPDQTIISEDHIKFIEVENEGTLQELKSKVLRYVRWYFRDGLKRDFPDKKFARVYIVESKPKKLIDLKDFILNLRFKDAGLKEQYHEKHPKIGRNMFMLAGTDFDWFQVSEKRQEEQQEKGGK